MRSHIQKNKVLHPPAKPLLLYDGKCRFCLRWATRLYRWVHHRIDYAPFQHNIKKFPEISPKMMRHYVQFVETDGSVYFGAAAAYKILAYKKGLGFFLWLYQKLPPFMYLSEAGYNYVSRHRHSL